MPVFSSYRNNSIDLHSKSINWSLNQGNTGVQRVNIRSEFWSGSLTQIVIHGRKVFFSLGPIGMFSFLMFSRGIQSGHWYGSGKNILLGMCIL